MLELETMYLVIIGLLTFHLFFFLGFQYQVLQLLDELAFPSDDPIMTSSLKEPVFEYEDDEEVAPVEAEPEEELEFDYAEEPVQPPVEAEPEPEEAVIETQIGYTTVNQLRRMKKDELIELCDMMGLDSDGTKTVLVDRIAKNQ